MISFCNLVCICSYVNKICEKFGGCKRLFSWSDQKVKDRLTMFVRCIWPHCWQLWVSLVLIGWRHCAGPSKISWQQWQNQLWRFLTISATHYSIGALARKKNTFNSLTEFEATDSSDRLLNIHIRFVSSRNSIFDSSEIPDSSYPLLCFPNCHL